MTVFAGLRAVTESGVGPRQCCTFAGHQVLGCTCRLFVIFRLRCGRLLLRIRSRKYSPTPFTFFFFFFFFYKCLGLSGLTQGHSVDRIVVNLNVEPASEVESHTLIHHNQYTASMLCFLFHTITDRVSTRETDINVL